jgi:predicted HicB family RNase H-like nuclease
MKNAMTYKDYIGTVEYSEDDNCLFGRIAGIRDIVSYEGESVAEIRKTFEEAVDDYNYVHFIQNATILKKSAVESILVNIQACVAFIGGFPVQLQYH